MEKFVPDFVFTVLGAGLVGKSALTLCALKRDINEIDDFNPTIEEDTYYYVMKHDGKDVKVQIIDTAGQTEYYTLIPEWIRQADGILLVYDITDEKTIQRLEEMRKPILRSSDDPNEKVVVLVGNKKDLEDKRRVSVEEGKKFAKNFYKGVNILKCTQCEIPYLETSAKTKENVDQVWELLLKLCIQNKKRKEEERNRPTRPRKKSILGNIFHSLNNDDEI